ncbi:hypothetical protein C4J94_1878 [Pseudomonas sp. R5-89-07]|nr:hypothetical protein C4J94_1878 [Pseudomonas sp. R5-89-07]
MCVGLPPMAVDQMKHFSLTYPYRGQAPPTWVLLQLCDESPLPPRECELGLHCR